MMMMVRMMMVVVMVMIMMSNVDALTVETAGTLIWLPWESPLRGNDDDDYDYGVDDNNAMN